MAPSGVKLCALADTSKPLAVDPQGPAIWSFEPIGSMSPILCTEMPFDSPANNVSEDRACGAVPNTLCTFHREFQAFRSREVRRIPTSSSDGFTGRTS